MTDFGDVERFAHAHSACGGITPSATPNPDGGYVLLLTCACGVVMRRIITPEEARVPLPLSAPPPKAAAPPKAPERRKAPPPVASDDLQEALRRALEAEDATEAPAAAPSRSSEAEGAPRLPAGSEAAAHRPASSPPPAASRVPLTNLDDAVQRALDADARAAAETAAAARPRERAVTPRPRLNLDAAVQRAVESQTTATVAARPGTSRFWFGLVVGMLVIGGLVFWLGLRALEEEARLETREPTAGDAAPAPAPDAERAAFAEALRALRDLQAASTPTVPYAAYASRVAFAKSDVDRYLVMAAAPELRAEVRDTMELHALAAAAWRARTLDSPEAWEAVGQNPVIDLCPSARRVIDFAEPPPSSRSSAHARGLGVAGAIPLLWECAGARLNALERAASG